jgi:hypothetical protein
MKHLIAIRRFVPGRTDHVEEIWSPVRIDHRIEHVVDHACIENDLLIRRRIVVAEVEDGSAEAEPEPVGELFGGDLGVGGQCFLL